jgi:anti-repressor protein
MAQILATKNAADWSGGECQIERRSKMTESNVQPFDFKGNQVRILADKKGEPWFVAKDVCNVLGITNNRDAISELDTDEKNTVVITDGIPGNPNKTIVSEAGLYRLVMKSRKPEAKEFQRWVTHEVLPSIRRHGVYATDVTIDSILNDPDFGIRLLTDLKDERARRREAERAIEAQKPKVLFADAVATSKRSILIGELAKILKQNGVKTGQNRLFKQLREDGFLMKRNGNPNMPTQKSMELGLFEVKETSIAHSDGHVSLNFTTKVTPKGQQYLIQKYLGCTPLDLEAGA